MNGVEVNFHDCEIQKIMDHIYIGDEFASKNRSLLESLKIKHIVVAGLELKPEHPDHFSYLVIPVRDSKKENISEYFSQSNQFIEKAISSNEDVLVHCAKGKSRSATIILAFMMYKYKLQHNKALVYVKRKRN